MRRKENLYIGEVLFYTMHSPASLSILYQSLFLQMKHLFFFCPSLPQALKNEWEELEASIQETTQNFDKNVCKLFEKKVNLEKVIYQVWRRTLVFHLYLCAAQTLIFITFFSQEELKIVNLIYSLMLDEELDSRKAGLCHFLVKKQKDKVSYHLECLGNTCNCCTISSENCSFQITVLL